jgi:flagellar biosynthesis/type III secretory pathway chaperone
MHSLFTELTALLRQEIEHYRRLLELVRRERNRIVQGNLSSLVELTQKKQAITTELAQLERSRQSLLDRLARELGEPAHTLTLAHVARRAPPEFAEVLNTLLSDFRGVIGRLVAGNDVNRSLLDRSLELVQGSLALFRTVMAANSTYDASGRTEPSEHALVALNQMA